MRIKLWIEDSDGNILEELGNCLTDSPNRAAQMYNDRCTKYDDQGLVTDVCWKDITDPAAKSLGSRGGKSTSDAKRSASRQNGKLGGRPKLK